MSLSISTMTARLAGCALALAALAAAPAHAANFSVLYAFKGGSDGAGPGTTLIKDAAGNLYGTTYGCRSNGFGTVFKLAPDGTETVLYAFKGGSDGECPGGPLAMDKHGNLYGTTFAAANSNGTIFSVSPNGVETVLHAFSTLTDGESPQSGVIRDKGGNLFGTASSGGADDAGTVFELTSSGTFIVLHSFTGPGDGQNPIGGLIMDKAGNLYGTTSEGGDDLDCNDRSGCGAVFRVASDGTETVLYSFLGEQGPNDGMGPWGSLVIDSAGNLYGTTTMGGADNGGTVFELSAAGKETILYSFGSSVGDGFFPEAALLRDTAGNLYGTTYSGANAACQQGTGCGNIFKISPDGSETILHAFTGGKDGGNSAGALIKGSNGFLYGTASTGGRSGNGVVFKVKK